MSNEFAIAAVTLTLRNLLDKIKEITDSDEYDQIPDDARPTTEILVTNLPLDEAYKLDKAKNQVNLFLYHVEHSGAWRNMNIPGRVKQGETGQPPLALNLYYVITAYGENGSELIGHLLLGKAMSLLHEHALFGRTEIKNAFALSGLHNQVERLRLTPQPISLDEVSKLWTGFQTQYRLSAAYQVSVVLIESKRPSKIPLPVLTRGAADKGVYSQPSLTPPYPTLETLGLPNNQSGIRLGEMLTLSGHHLQGDGVVVRFMNHRLSGTNESAALAGNTDTEVQVVLPDEPADWPAGIYSVALVVSTPGKQDRTTNELPLMLTPQITNITIAPLSPPAAGAYSAMVNCTPQVLPDQSATLMLGDREFPALDHPAKTDILTFTMRDIFNGEYYVRLRIDGVDSLLIDRSVTPPVFDVSQRVTIS